MGHVDMFWVYFILYFAYIVSDEDCHVVYDLVRKLCELEGWRMGGAGFTRHGTGILLMGTYPFSFTRRVPFGRIPIYKKVPIKP